MIKFELNLDMELTVTKDERTLQKSIYLGNIFTFLGWCENWMDKNGLFEEEYMCFIRIH